MQAPVDVPKAQKEWGPDTTSVPGTKIEAVQGEVPIISSETVPPSPVVAATPTEMAAEDDTAGSALSFAAVQEIMDEMVRPALQGDGGDITLIRIENNDVYVKLVGSCSTCPSSIMTMKMGVEALLKEEFPIMGSLIQVE
jgi:Fe-S cluster biogenesis protein NfuA